MQIQIMYNGTDISQDVSPFMVSFRYVDRTVKDRMDELSVAFQNVEGLWRTGWWPEQGAKLQATINTSNWFSPGDQLKRECGSFEIDDLTDTGPPNVFSVNSVAIGITASIRREERSKAWENFKVSAIAGEISKRHGFKLFFDSKYDPILDRFDQKSESDLAFLRRACDYAGLMLKITDNTIVVYRGEDYDKKEAELTITKDHDGYISHSFNSNSADVYSACEVKYYDPAKKELVSYLYKPDGISGTMGGASEKKKSSSGGGGKGGSEYRIDPVTRMAIPNSSGGGGGKSSSSKEDENKIKEPEVGQVLRVNRRCSSLAEAEEVAKAALRNKNMRAIRGNILFMGHPILFSGMNIAISGFGRWDSATWMVEEVTHSWTKSAGYKTEVSLRGVLGY